MKKSKIYSLGIIALFLIFSCNKKSKEDSINSSTTEYKTKNVTTSPYYVNATIAEQFAERITEDVFLTYSYNHTRRIIDNYYSIPDANGDPALYIFNYANNEGYTVISADLRYTPICAFVKKGNLLKTSIIPSMLGSWYGTTIERINYLRDLQDIGDEATGGIEGWVTLSKAIHLEDLPNPNVVKSAVNGDPCYDFNPPTITVKNPLLQTAWGQGCFL
jgi:hypothetical protein